MSSSAEVEVGDWAVDEEGYEGEVEGEIPSLGLLVFRGRQVEAGTLRKASC